jgi:hypothetical protein
VGREAVHHHRLPRPQRRGEQAFEIGPECYLGGCPSTVREGPIRSALGRFLDGPLSDSDAPKGHYTIMLGLPYKA